MRSFCLASALVLVSCLVHGDAASCSDILGYHKNDGRWEAVLAVTAPEDYVSGEEFKVEVSMAVRKKQEGLEASLELSESVVEAETKLRAGGRLTYRVRFPVPDSAPLPRVTAVTTNGAPVCQEEEGFGSASSSPLQVSHVLSGQEILSNSTHASQAVPALELSSSRPLNSTLQTPSESLSDSADSCGVRMFPEGTRCSDAMYPLSDAREWPWVAALISLSDESRIANSGTLVTRNHVVTVAFKFIRNPQFMNTYSLLVVFGIGDMRNYRGQDTNSQVRKVTRIVTHPGIDYTFLTTRNDVAVLVLESPVVITPHVRPVCLWQDASQTSAGREGYVVGWDTLTKYARSFDAPVKDLEHCSPKLRKRASNQTVCVGKQNGFGLCLGGFGAGLYVPERRQDGGTRWLFAAMMTYVPSRNNKDELCNHASHSLFQDIPKLAPWINTIINAKDSDGATTLKVGRV